MAAIFKKAYKSIFPTNLWGTFGVMVSIFWCSLLVILSVSANSNLIITDIRVGTEIDKTRVVFEMSFPVSLYVQDRGDGQFLVTGPEDTFWQVPEQKQIDKGPLKSYEIVKMDVGKGCLLQFDKYTHLMGSFGRGQSYFLDLETRKPPPPPPPPKEESPPEAPLNLPDPKPTVPIVMLNQKVDVKPNEINSLSVLPKEDGTTWIIINADRPEFYEYQLIRSTNELHLYLPKINWPNLNTEIVKSGVVMSYSVDETLAGVSSVVMQLNPGATVDVIDLFSAPNLDGTHDFVLILDGRMASSDEVARIAARRMHLKQGAKSSSESFEFRPPMAFYGEKAPEGPYLPEGVSDTTLVPEKDESDPLFDGQQVRG